MRNSLKERRSVSTFDDKNSITDDKQNKQDIKFNKIQALNNDAILQRQLKNTMTV